MTPNGSKEFIWVAPGLKIKGYDKCFKCSVGINFSDKHYINLPDYVEVECQRCGSLNRLPIFREGVDAVKYNSSECSEAREAL